MARFTALQIVFFLSLPGLSSHGAPTVLDEFLGCHLFSSDRSARYLGTISLTKSRDLVHSHEEYSGSASSSASFCTHGSKFVSTASAYSALDHLAHRLPRIVDGAGNTVGLLSREPSVDGALDPDFLRRGLLVLERWCLYSSFFGDLDAEYFIQAADGTFLGFVDTDRNNDLSIINDRGPHGSTDGSRSVYNTGGRFGSAQHPLSAYSVDTSTPPVIHRREKKSGLVGFVAYLTKNKNIHQARDPDELRMATLLAAVPDEGMILPPNSSSALPLASSSSQPSYSSIDLRPLFPPGGHTDPAGWHPAGQKVFGPYPSRRFIYSHSDDPVTADDTLYLNGLPVDDQGYSRAVFGGKTAFLLEVPSGKTFTVEVWNHGGSYGCRGSLRVYESPLADVPGTRTQRVFFNLPRRVYVGGEYKLRARATSKLPITYEISNPSAGVVENSVLRIKAAVPFTVTARQSGDYRWAENSKAVELNPRPLRQRIAMTVRGQLDVGQPAQITVTMNSTMVPDVSATPPGVVTIGGPTNLGGNRWRYDVLAIAPGRAKITATQDGDSNHAEARPVKKSVVVR